MGRRSALDLTAVVTSLASIRRMETEKTNRIQTEGRPVKAVALSRGIGLDDDRFPRGSLRKGGVARRSNVTSRPTTKSGITPIAQGVFFAAAGLWPLVHLRSFEAVTGPKKDDWLVKTIGGIIAVIGGSLLVGGLERSRSRALKALGVGSAMTLGGADVVYVARGRIAPIYLADAAVQALILGAWLVESRRSSSTSAVNR